MPFNIAPITIAMKITIPIRIFPYKAAPTVAITKIGLVILVNVEARMASDLEISPLSYNSASILALVGYPDNMLKPKIPATLPSTLKTLFMILDKNRGVVSNMPLSIIKLVIKKNGNNTGKTLDENKANPARPESMKDVRFKKINPINSRQIKNRKIEVDFFCFISLLTTYCLY